MSVEMFMRCGDAVRLFKQASVDCKFAIPINQEIHFPGANSGKSPKAFAKRYLTIARQQAIKLVRGMIEEDVEKNGGRVKITEMYLDNGNKVYWIG
jgi:hypothetical protein